MRSSFPCLPSFFSAENIKEAFKGSNLFFAVVLEQEGSCVFQHQPQVGALATELQQG